MKGLKMKSIFNFFNSQKKEYIGLSDFKIKDSVDKMQFQPAKKQQTVEKTSLTGLLKRV